MAYQPSIAFDVAGRLAPLATLLVAAATLFLALPVYWYIAGRSPNGGGSAALLERVIRGWPGKLLVLSLLAFGAVDLVFTRTFSAANAAEHLMHSPDAQWQASVEGTAVYAEELCRGLHPKLRSFTEGLWSRHTVVTLFVLLISTIMGLLTFRGYTRNFVRLAAAVVATYLLLTLIVIGSGVAHLLEFPQLLQEWWANIENGQWKPGSQAPAPQGWLDLAAACIPLFPLLALGLSGFELTLMAMPLIRGDRKDTAVEPRGRIRNTRVLLTVAAVLMSAYLLASTLVATVLIPPEALITHGQAKNRAVSYLAHGGALTDQQTAAGLGPWFGLAFGTVYDAITVLMLALAGLSVALTMSKWIPPHLHRLGMEFNWSVRLGLLTYIFIAVKIAVVVYYGADLEAQRAAYLTSVLAVFSLASVVAAADLWKRRAARRSPQILRLPLCFIVAGLIFALSGLRIAWDRPAAVIMTGAFIAAVLTVSILSRLWRNTELRFQGFQFADEASRLEWKALCVSTLPILVPLRSVGEQFLSKEREIRSLHRIPGDMPIMFLKADVGDASDFTQSPVIRVTRDDGRVLIHITECVSVAHALAAAALELASDGVVPEVHFGWSEENPISANIHFVLFGSGNIPWMVYSLIRRSAVPENRKPRVMVG